MPVIRIVPNLLAADPSALAAFWRDVLGLETLMEMGFIHTLGGRGSGGGQLSVASEGGSGTPLPQVSIEVDDLEDALARAKAAGGVIEYGPVTEPWGVRRFYLRDPGGNLVNILVHEEKADG